MKTYQLSQPRRKMRIWDAGATMDPPVVGIRDASSKWSCGAKTWSCRAQKEPLGFHDAGKPLRHSTPRVLSGQTPCWEQTLHLLPKPQRPLIKMQASKQSRPRSPAIITPPWEWWLSNAPPRSSILNLTLLFHPGHKISWGFWAPEVHIHGVASYPHPKVTDGPVRLRVDVCCRVTGRWQKMIRAASALGDPTSKTRCAGVPEPSLPSGPIHELRRPSAELLCTRTQRVPEGKAVTNSKAHRPLRQVVGTKRLQ